MTSEEDNKQKEEAAPPATDVEENPKDTEVDESKKEETSTEMKKEVASVPSPDADTTENTNNEKAVANDDTKDEESTSNKVEKESTEKKQEDAPADSPKKTKPDPEGEAYDDLKEAETQKKSEQPTKSSPEPKSTDEEKTTSEVKSEPEPEPEPVVSTSPKEVQEKVMEEEVEEEETVKKAKDGEESPTTTNPFGGDDEEPDTSWANDDEPDIVVGKNEFEEKSNSDVSSKQKAGKPKKSKKTEESNWAKSDAGGSAPAVVIPYTTTTVQSDGMGGVKIGGVHINHMRLPLILLLGSGCALLAAVLTYKGTWKINRNYALSVPSTNMCIAFLMLLMTFSPSLYRNYGKYPGQLLVIWNFIGACILTFDDPFTSVGNGYFAAWLSVVFSAMALGLSSTTFVSTVRGMGALSGLFLSSIIVIIALTGVQDAFGKSAFYRNESIFAMCVSVTTLLLVPAYIIRQKMTKGKAAKGCEGIVGFVFLCIFAVLWLAVGAVCTFRGPFDDVGNGYFACWTGAACAFFACFASRNNPDKETAHSQKGGITKENWAEDDDSPV